MFCIWNKSFRWIHKMVHPPMVSIDAVSHEIPPSIFFDTDSHFDIGIFGNLVPKGCCSRFWSRYQIKIWKTSKSHIDSSFVFSCLFEMRRETLASTTVVVRMTPRIVFYYRTNSRRVWRIFIGITL